MIVETQMRQALINTLHTATKQTRDVAMKIATSADVGNGKKPMRDWNAKLSLRTYTHLKDIGVMS